MAVMDIVGILLTTARVTTDNTIVLAERHRQPLVLNSAFPVRRSLGVRGWRGQAHSAVHNLRYLPISVSPCLIF